MLKSLLLGLKENKQLQSVDALYSISIQNVVTLLENKKCFRGTGGDAMRAATCYFIQRASQVVHQADCTVKIKFSVCSFAILKF